MSGVFCGDGDEEEIFVGEVIPDISVGGINWHMHGYGILVIRKECRKT
jgi:hypothetical protein